MSINLILELLTAFSGTLPEVLAIIKAFQTAINGTPGTPEHTAAIAALTAAHAKATGTPAA